MSADELQFRTTALGGFHKQDVLAYLERTGQAHTQQLEALQKELTEARSAQSTLEEERAAAVRQAEELTRENDQLKKDLEARSKELEEIRSEQASCTRRLAELEREADELRSRLSKAEPAAEAYERIKNRTAGMELEALRRAQDVEDAAQEKAAHAQADLEQWLDQVQAGYHKLRTGMEEAVAHASGEIEEVRKKMKSLAGQFGEGEGALAALLQIYKSAEGPKAPEPLPLKENTPE